MTRGSRQLPRVSRVWGKLTTTWSLAPPCPQLLRGLETGGELGANRQERTAMGGWSASQSASTIASVDVNINSLYLERKRQEKERALCAFV
jgi:hypothetical protein